MKKIIKKILIIAAMVAFFLFGNNCLAASSLDVTVIEIGAYKTGGYEYIKIFNNTNQTIDLEGWKFVEGFSATKPDGIKHSLNEFNAGFSLSPNAEAVICQDPIKFSVENNFTGLILDSSWGSLNESGERLQLLDGEGNVVEDFTYIKAKENVLKRIDFTLPDYTSNNWKEFATTQEEESAQPESSSGQEFHNKSPSTNQEESPKIIFTEILPNPTETDNKKEFIEITNTGNRTISLNGWQLQDNSERIFTIDFKNYSDSLLRPNYFFIFYRDETGIALNNFGGDEIKLYDSKGKLIDKISYIEKAEEGLSYAKDDTDIWRWTTKQTPGEKNNLDPINNYPVIEIEAISGARINEQVIFDASDSYDPDGDELFFMWDFDDDNSSTLIDPTHSYNKAGKYKIKLTIFDNRNASTTENFLINIFSDKIKGYKNGEILKQAQDDRDWPQDDNNKKYPLILISEIFPNPAGRDDQEFIELFNPNPFEIDLSGWTLKDESKSGKFKIKNNTIVEAQEYIVFTKSDTKINLNNNSDSIYLMGPDEDLIDKISYDKAKEEMSYNVDKNNNWSWTYNITPWEEPDFLDFSSFTDYSEYFTSNEPDPLIELEDIKNLEPGSRVEVIGLVTVPPGLLGKQIFYLEGLQIYMYNKNFPKLELGDKVKIFGEISKAQGETRIKIKTQDDIEFLNKKDLPIEKEVFIEDIDDNLIGNLIKVNGEITEHKGDTLWIDDDTQELKIKINKYTGINLDKCAPGQIAEVTGILTKTESGYRLLPRYLEDINLGSVLGEKAYAAEENHKPTKNKLNKYLIVTALAVLVLSIGIVLKNKKRAS